MPYKNTDPLPSDEILKRVTKVIMAFVGTYAYTKASNYTKYACESTCTFPVTWPIPTKGSEWAQRMKAVNPNATIVWWMESGAR